MGTRGAICLVVDGVEKTIYNHYDSYPAGLGAEVLTFVRMMNASQDEQSVRDAVRALQPVPDREPEAADFERLAKFHDRGVSTGRDWYSLLRHTQGDLGATLDAGYYEPSPDFPRDSLWCEWAYVVDFDARQFEVYEGFQKSPPTEGRWIGQEPVDPSSDYYPIQRMAAWSFDELPTADELVGVDPDEDDE